MLMPADVPPIQDYTLGVEFTQASSGVSQYVTEVGPHRIARLDLSPRLYGEEVSLVMTEFADRSEALQRILEIEKLEADWDGYGAEPICAACIENARTIVELLPPFAVSPDLFPNPNGTVTLEWENARGTLSIEVGEAGISGFFDADAEPLFYQEDYAGGMPAFVESALRQMTPTLSGDALVASSVMDSYARHGNLTRRYYR